MGAANKVSGNKIANKENKCEEKQLRKKFLSLGKMRSETPGVFLISSLFSMVVNILCFHAFSTIRGLFFVKNLEPEKSPRK